MLFVDVVGVLLLGALLLRVAQLPLPELLELAAHLLLVVPHVLQSHLVLFKLHVLLIQLVVPLKRVLRLLRLSKASN